MGAGRGTGQILKKIPAHEKAPKKYRAKRVTQKKHMEEMGKKILHNLMVKKMFLRKSAPPRHSTEDRSIISMSKLLPYYSEM